MRRTEPTRAVFAFTGALALSAAHGACTYDFDKFDQAPSTSAGASGSAGQGAAIGGAPTAGSSAGGSSGSTSAGGSGGAFDCSALAGAVWNDHCYFVVGASRGLRWDAAGAACSQNGGAHLVTVTTAAEQTMLAQTFGRADNDDFWIGLSLQNVTRDPDRSCEQTPDQCPFFWVGGEPLAYTNWAEHSARDREPNYTGACVRLQGADFRWADFGCSTQLLAICERDGQLVP